MPTKRIYKHVLLATDLSTPGKRVAKRATDIAKSLHAKLSIVHVFAHAPVAYAGEFSIPIDAEFELSLKHAAMKRLTKFAKTHHIPGKMTYLKEGSVKGAVIGLAKKIRADLIIVGERSHDALGAILGSQASAILHAAHCDVWVIRIK